MYLDIHLYIHIYILFDTYYLIIIIENETINLKTEEHRCISKEDSWEVLEGGKREEKLIEFYFS